MFRRFLLSQIIFTVALCGQAKAIYDSPDAYIKNLFKEARTKYIIKFNHTFSDTLKVPIGCELSFDGGSLSGPIAFAGTKLSGMVNLRGSSLFGTIENKVFEADWLCAMDGVTDDSQCINEMIQVCGNVHFPKGRYRLRSKFNPEGVVDKSLHSQVQTHIGINRSDVRLVGDEGAEFITDIPLGTIFVFSQPNQIENSIRNIEISGLIFTVHNDGKQFHEFMHTIKLMGVNGMTIKNCQFNDFWGDAICLSHYGDNPQTGERTRNQNVRILDNQIIGGEKHSNRNGISVISGKNVIIRGNTIKNTSRIDMPGGIDVEPNNSAYTIENIMIEKNVLEDIQSNAIQIYIPKGGPAHNVTIKGNTIKSCKCGLCIGIVSDNTTDGIKIIRNKIDTKTLPYNFVGSAHSADWVISNNVFLHPSLQVIPGDIKVENLLVKNNKKKD